MIEDIERVLLSEEQIHGIVSRLGRQISEDYKGKKLLMVSLKSHVTRISVSPA